MATFGSSDAETLSARIREIPPPLLPRIRGGYHSIGQMSGSQRDECVTEVVKHLSDGRAPQIRDIPALSGLRSPDGNNVLISISVVFGLLVDLEISIDEFIAAASGEICESEDLPTLRYLASKIVPDRKALKVAVEEASLASQILPSLSMFDLEVDLRMRFEDGKLQLGVPIAVVHIDTDCQNQEIWLQLKLSEVQNLIEKLKKTEADLKSAELILEKYGAEL